MLLLGVHVKCDIKLWRCEMEKIGPKKVVEILRKQGIDVTEEQAKALYELLSKLSNIVVTQYLENENCRFIHPCEHG